MTIIQRIALTLFLIRAISAPLLFASTVSDTSAGGIVPEVGRWKGTTTQGHPINFYFSTGGSIFEPDAYAVDFECPTSGPQLWGFAFALVEILIVEGRVEFLFELDSPRQIRPGAHYALRGSGEFTTPTECRGILDNGISVFTGDGVGTELCPLPGITWTASWVGPATPGELEEHRSCESDTIGPIAASQKEMLRDIGVDESASMVVPRDGYWSGTSSQGLFLEFNVADGGSIFAPEEFDAFITCPTSPYQSWGFSASSR